MGNLLGTGMYKNAMTSGPVPFPLVGGRCPLCGPFLTKDLGVPCCKRCMLYWIT
jgi:hypothetical protein